MESLHFLQLHGLSIFEQLQIEEALLRVDTRNWCLINWNAPPAIVLGISGKVEEMLYLQPIQQNPIPLIRRFSGGGTVVVNPHTCFVTFICNTSTIPIPPFPEKIMRWTESLYAPLFTPHPFQLIENDYVIGNRKCGGNAQSISKGRWLHHSSFLWDYCPAQMAYLKIPSKAPVYRAGRSHADFLCCLKEYWQAPELFFESLKQLLSQRFHLVENQQEEIEHLRNIPHRQATTFI